MASYFRTAYDRPFEDSQWTPSAPSAESGTTPETPVIPPIYATGPGTPPPSVENPNPGAPTNPPSTPVTAPTTTTPYNREQRAQEIIAQFSHLPWVAGPENQQNWMNYLLGPNGLNGSNEDYWIRRISDAPGQGSNAGAAGGGLNLSGVNFNSLFDDPATSQLMSFLSARINGLTQPIHDPNADALTSQIQQALAAIQSSTSKYGPQIDQIIASLQQPDPNVTGPTAQYRDIIAKLVSDLSGPAFSDEELAKLKTAAVDTLAHEHQQALQNKIRELGARGITPTSGLVSEATKGVDQQYQTLKAQQLQDLNTKEIGMANERRGQLLTAASAGLTASQQEAAANAARMNQLLNALTTAQTQQTSAATQGVTLAQALEQLSRGQRQEQNANLNQATSLMSIPVDLSSQRLSQALQVLGLGSGGTNATSLLQTLQGIANQAQNANQTNQSNSSNLWLGIGNILSQILAGYA